jgi:RIO kinase 2
LASIIHDFLTTLRLTISHLRIDDGYRFTYGGLDYLALHYHLKSSTIFSLGPQLGVGKESDIYAVASPSGKQLVLKLHRLGRISFRSVKSNRDYLRGRNAGSWLYMARLAALKEYNAMRVLHANGFPVPEPVAQNRHTVLMELVEGWPLVKVKEVPDPAALYAKLIALIVRFAAHGLIHGDFNEFNILIEEKPDSTVIRPVVIDFPQIISTLHPNAAFYFDRDVNCIKRFFERRFHFESSEPGPYLEDILENGLPKAGQAAPRLDVEIEASGFSRKMARELETYMQDPGEEDTSYKLESGMSEDSEASDEDNGALQGEEDPDHKGYISNQENIPQVETPTEAKTSTTSNLTAPWGQGQKYEILRSLSESQVNQPKGNAKAVGWSI